MQFKTKPSVGLIRFAVAVLVSQYATSAMAQSAPENENRVQRVEVTGSSIKRTASESAGSVYVLTKNDIATTGANTALDVLKNTAAISTSINSETNGSGSFATGASAAGMRGLSKVATLVLVNGRRIAPYGLSDGAQDNFTNLDAIAADAIERIEILKDGASAIYGSDAIAGVINIILKKNYVGGEVFGGYKVAQQFHKNNSKSASITYGFGDIETDGFNTYFSIEAYRRPGYTTGDLREYYPGWHRLTPGRSTWDAKSTYSPTGNYFLSATNIVAAPGCPSGSIDPVDKQCKFDVLPYSGQTTDNKRHAFVSNTSFKIGNDINANFEVTFANANNSYLVAPLNVSNGSTTAATNIWYNVYGKKMVGPFSYPKLPVGHPNNPYNFPVEYRARMMDTGNGFNFNSTDSKQYRVMLALDGSIGAYEWKSAFGFMDSTANKATRAVSANEYTNAIVNGTYKFGQQNDRSLLEKMFPIRTTDGRSKIAFFDATLTGELFKMPAGPVSFALGTDIRKDSYEMKSSDNVLNGELVGVFGLQAKDTRIQSALFTEANIPVLKNLELSAALRADKTQGFDKHFSPKLGFRFTPNENWLLRSTYSSGFRAPNIVESGKGLGRSSVSTSVNDPKRCPIASELNNLVQNSKTATAAEKTLANNYRSADCSAGLPSFTTANPDVKPETAKTFTLGFVFAPTKSFSVAIDYFNIERKDQIATRTVADILKGEDSLPAGTLTRIDNSQTDNEFLSLVKKHAANNTIGFQGIGKLALLNNPYVNSGKTRTSGLDYDITSVIKLNQLGELKIRLEGLHGLNFQTYSVTNQKYSDDQYGTYDMGGRNQIVLTTSLKRGNWSNAIVVDHQSGYSSNSLGSPTYCETNKVAPEYMANCVRIEDSTFVNYSLTYTGFKDTRINLYVGNITNKQNPIHWRDGWSASFRTIYLNANYKFK